MSASGNKHFPLLDGGIGWLSVLAGAISNFVAMGLYRSGGIIYMASVKYFSASRSVAAWVPMITMMLVFFTAPIGTFLSTRFTFHKITIIGSILATAGMFINFLAFDIETIFIGWSILFGIGSSLAFFPSVAAVGQCFKKKRPLANSIVLAGSAFGSSCLPPLMEYSIDTYGLNGACLVMTGVVTQFFVVAALLKAVFNVTRKPPPPKLISPTKEKPLASKEKYLAKLFHLDLSFMENCTFLVNAVANAIQCSLFFAMLTILPDFAAEEIRVSRIKGAYLVSATAFADLASRLPAGIFFLKIKWKKSVVYAMVLVVNVLDLLVLVFARDYYVAMAAAAIGGACFAFGMVLYFEILASCQTQKKYPTAFGFSEMVKAPFLLLTATTVGSLKDATGSYSTTFVIFAVAGSLAIALWIFEILWHLKRNSKTIESNVEINLK